MNPFYETPGERQQRKLEKNGFSNDWKRVIKIYNKYPHIREATITAGGDTALHLAITATACKAAEELVSIAAADGGDALKAINEFGNTPLHLAAFMGDAEICACIARHDGSLIGRRNKAGETPLFLAVRHGWREAFRVLRQMDSTNGTRYAYFRASDGQTILHSAIDHEYFDLAYEIMNYYPDFAETMKEEGVKTPLHILASKPHVFKSGSNLEYLDILIYFCIGVIKLKVNGEDINNPQWSTARLLRQLSSKIGNPLGQCVKKIDVEDPADGRQHHQPQQGHKSIFSKYFQPCLRFASRFLNLLPKRVANVRKVKQNHVWSVQIFEKLLELEDRGYIANKNGNLNDIAVKFNNILDHFPVEPNFDDDYESDGKPATAAGDGDDHAEDMENKKKESALLIAAKNGIMEIVERILDMYPVAIQDLNSEKKNIVLLAVENRQSFVYKHLIKTIQEQPSVYYKMDNDGNGALHLAAMNREYIQPEGIPGPALLMQWEIKWYEFVKNSTPLDYFVWRNKAGKTPEDIFIDDHKLLIEKSSEWLKSTAESCSVVATLIATVAFATSTAIPGGVNSNNGVPVLEREMAFSVFGISSLVALSFSVCSTFMFLGFINSSHHEKDFIWYVPIKILLGLTCLFISLAAMLVSFCAAHYLIMKQHLNFAAFPLYLLILLLVTVYASAQFPWYWGVVSTTFNSLPQKCRKRQFT